MNEIIKVENLVKRYNKAEEPSVRGVDFHVDEGEFFAFLGPNGAGKTTTISILTTTLSKTSGRVEIAGYDLDKDMKKIRENVGIIFQKPSLDKALSAEENIRFHACLYGMYPYRPTFKMMPAEYRKRVVELADIVGIGDSLFQAIGKMSGGMQRKLEIIRSLIHTPKVLFLDEPTQGLDAVSRKSLWEYIQGIRKEFGTTVFLTTHYIDEAENVDKVCIINNGEMEFSGSPDRLKEKLLKRELILNSDDRGRLVEELKNMNLNPIVDKEVRVSCKNLQAQEIIINLDSKLTTLKIHEPSLEDAYFELLEQSSKKQTRLDNVLSL
ncbi:MAG: ATP-binding cassette domain-containing protein [Clostridioides sp.]|nr:ATP-binding cassette domain-containing protein [Clostridioides sp.]